MCLFKLKKILKVEIIAQSEGIDENDQLTNLAAGHMMGGFDGMVHASLLNESEGPTTTFLITYDNGTSETINFRIVDMSVDHVSKTEKASLTIMADNIVSISPTTLASSYKNHSRNLHEMDTASAFLDKIFSAMPSELQSVIKPYWISELVAGYPKLTNIFVAHSVNLGVSHDGFGNQDTPNYNETYKYFADGASIKRTKLTNAYFDDYWTSAVVNWQSGSYYKYWYLAIDGTARMNAGQIPDSNSHGIVPCFCI